MNLAPGPTLEASAVEDSKDAAGFADGETIGGRFRIERLLGRGGMGAVYEADDLLLGERVAIKTVRPEGESELAAARFRREIQLARKVTHPNVCRIFEAGVHEGKVAFVAMELLRGVTLSERLRRDGRMSPAQALPIVKQMSAGLAAAHAAGIIHRDLKSGNVMLVDGDSGPRAVITDFGIARHASSEPGATEVTEPGQLVGSPGYMAPEQLDSSGTTPAADIYSLGVVLFEMVTGRLPFLGDTPLAMAIKRLQVPPPSPRELCPDLPARWDAVILRCLERAPKDRYPSALAVAEALPAPRPRSRWLARTLALALALAAGAATAVWRLWPARTAETPAHRLAPPHVIALLGFRGVTDHAETRWLGPALDELLEAGLGAPSLRIVSGDTMARLRHDLDLRVGETPTPAALEKLRTATGAEVVVTGTYETGDRIEVTLALADASGRRVGTARSSGRPHDLTDIAATAADEVREELGLPDAPADRALLRSRFPVSQGAARLYVEATEKLRGMDPRSARELLDEAARLEPDSPQVHDALSQVWIVLGFDARAREEAERAQLLAAGLPRSAQLGIAARYHERRGEWDQAIAAYRELQKLEPLDLDTGLRLADAIAQLDEAEGAKAYEALRALPAPLSLDPRIDVGIAKYITDPALRALALDRAKARALELNDRVALAAARMTEANGFGWSMRIDESVSAALEARAASAAAGDRAGEMHALQMVAAVKMIGGQLIEARDTFDQIIQLARLLGATDREGMALVESSLASYMAGDLADMRSRLERAEELWPRCDGLCLSFLLPRKARLLAADGKYAEAEAVARQALDAATKDHHRISPWLAIVHARLDAGNLAGAAAERKALLAKLAEPLPVQVYLDMELVDARISAASKRPADVAAARKRAQTVLAKAREAHFLFYEYEARLLDGELELRHGDPAKGRAALTALVREARGRGWNRVAGQAEAELAR